MANVLFVSPHLDDAVLSCAGAIRRHVMSGDRVVVATVFSEGQDGARRRDEDRAAIESLGAAAVHVGLFDAPERLGLARSHRALVEEAVAADDDIVRVRTAVDAVVGHMADARIHAPLGVGDHVDHRVVHAALRSLGAVAFYEDRPYAFLPGAVRARLRALGLRAECVDALPDPALVRTALEMLPHLRSYAQDDDRGARARGWLASKVRDDTEVRELREVRSHTIAGDAETARAAAHAIGLYASQVDALFGGPEHIAPALRRAAADAGADPSAAHAERTFMLAAR